MRKGIMSLAIAAAMQTMQGMPQQLRTTGHRVSAGGSPFNKRNAKNRMFFRKSSISKYKSHQGKQECARRLHRGSAAWYSATCMVK